MRSLIAPLLLLLASPAAAQDATISVVAASDGTRTLSHELVIPAELNEAWLAVSTVDGWRTWAVPLIREIPGTDRFETNYNPAAEAGSASGIEQSWLNRQAPVRISFKTTRTPQGFPYAEAYLKVVSTFTLSAEGQGKTRVRLDGAGYPEGAAGDALIAFFKSGNSQALRQLHERFANGPKDWSKVRE